jgi:glycosyltransferase involved in cell wall biosynthesis
MPTFSLVTTCKGRLDHLKQTLASMLSQGFHEVLVVDYDCPHGTAEWIRTNHPSVSLVEIKNEPLFNVAKARNVGASRSSGDVLCFVDADVVLAEGYLRWFGNNFAQDSFYILGVGSPVCTRAQFETIGGYDDVIAGWGGEDLDFCLRLKQAGYDLKLFPKNLVQDRIRHSDLMRTAYYDVKDKRISTLRARYYIAAKQKIASLTNISAVPRRLRENLYLQTDCINADYQEFKKGNGAICFEADLASENGRKLVVSISRKEAKHLVRVRDEMKIPRGGFRPFRYNWFKRLLQSRQFAASKPTNG